MSCLLRCRGDGSRVASEEERGRRGAAENGEGAADERAIYGPHGERGRERERQSSVALADRDCVAREVPPPSPLSNLAIQSRSNTDRIRPLTSEGARALKRGERGGEAEGASA